MTVLEFGREILKDEARALNALAENLGAEFERAVEIVLGMSGKLLVGGLGKSGHIARKIAATFASTGTTATFLHLSEAVHGDLGMAAPGDVALLISRSGDTPELDPVIDHLERIADHRDYEQRRIVPGCRRASAAYPAALARGGARSRGSRDVDHDVHCAW